jgi:nicotinate phosphoribosyltransferase
LAARGRAVADFGFRRAQGLETGIEAALAAYVGGGFTTSNVEAGRRHGLQVVGTMAHSFVQAFDTEIDAFRAFVQDHPEGAVLLVDTYDTVEGVRQAIVVAQEMRERGHSLRGVRLDSGDLLALSRATRDLLDEAGFGEVEVLASGGLDEERIHALVEAGAPIDAFGVGTDLVVSKDRPALDIAYKLVAYGGEARAKSSEAKANLPGAKQVFRTAGPDTDLLALRTETHPGRALLEPVWRDGVRLDEESPAQVRARVEAELDTLPQAWRRPPYPESPPRPRLSAQLEALTARVRTSHHIPEQDAGAGRRTQ